MKSLYADDKTTLAGMELAKLAADQGIRAAFNWAIENGYSVREASHVIQWEVLDFELNYTVLGPEKK